MTRQQIAKTLGCSEEQLKAQYAANAKGLARMRDKAKLTGKKQGGFSEVQLTEMVIKFEALSL